MFLSVLVAPLLHSSKRPRCRPHFCRPPSVSSSREQAPSHLGAPCTAVLQLSASRRSPALQTYNAAKVESLLSFIYNTPIRCGYCGRWCGQLFSMSRYIVFSGLHNYGRGGRQLGFSVHALSKTLGPDEICSRIDAFLPQFRELLLNMTEEVG